MNIFFCHVKDSCRRMTRCPLFFPLASCVLFTSLSPFTMELIAPSVSSFSSTLTTSLVEESFPVYFGVIALVHLAHGFLVSKAGTVVVCLYGSLMYGTGSMALASHDVTGIHFHLSRSLQAIGASACSVAGFAMIKTHLQPKLHLPIINLIRSLILLRVFF